MNGAYDWFPDWTGQTCAIIASGPSAKECPIALLRDRVRVVVVNTSFQLAPWADVLYACDFKWWKHYNGVPEFKGLKVSHESSWRTFDDVRSVSVDAGSDEILVGRRGHLGGGAGSGFQAANLVVQFGISRILLIGYDMVDGEHWHDRHPAPLSNPDLRYVVPRWRRALDGAAIRLYQLGVVAINCSPVSALKNFKKMPLEEALKCLH